MYESPGTTKEISRSMDFDLNQSSDLLGYNLK
ncbi:hypothetical protein MTR67_006037, partial [Solanum verrucosum]